MYTPTIFQPLTVNDADRDKVLIEHTGSLIGLLDEHGALLYLNPAARCVVGDLPGTDLTTAARALLHPDDLPAVRNQWQDVLASGSGLLLFRVRAADGTWRWLETHATCTEHNEQQYVIVVGHDITDHKHAEDEWQHGSELFRVMMESVQDYAIFALDLEGQIVTWNTGAERVFGYIEAEAVGQVGDMLFTPEDRAANAPQQEMRNALTKGHAEDERWHVRKDGSRFWASGMVTPLQNTDGQVRGFVKVARDYTAQKQAEAERTQVEAERERLICALEAERAQLEIVLESISDAFYAVDSQFHFTYVNNQAEEWWKRQRHDLIGKHYWTVFPHIVGSDSYNMHLQVMRDRQPVHYETFSPLVQRWVAVSIYPSQDGGLSVYFQDITARKLAEQQLEHQAAHDALTGLPNRTTFLDHVRRAIARNGRHSDYQFAVLFLDLDRFKVINDSLGHHVGDCLLIETAKRLEHCVRPEDVVARLGGDEFAVLLDTIHDVHDAIAVVNRIHAAIATPVTLDGHTVTTATSIGVTLGNAAYTQPEEILRDADTAMYWAKRGGAGRHAVFDQSMHTRALARLRLETELQRAVERQEFRLHYQPLVELATGRIHGFEALVRWQHPERGLIAPAEFVGVAEETGLIHAIGRWVLREACQQMRHWHIQFPAIPRWMISVNLSGVQCRHADLVDYVAQVLRDTDLAPRYLELEITESVMLGHTDAALALLRDLEALGVTLTLDDFGTGYSSLSYLHRFPVSTLKIDRSFINNVDADGEHGELVRAIIALARNLHMGVVAEGIETAAQRDHLAALGCGYGQGHLFARPLDVAAVERLLVSEQKRGATVK